MVIDMDIAADRVRLNVADTGDIPILPTSVYEYLLTKYSNNETAATKEAAYLILGQLSGSSRERLDRIEFYGHQKFEQYLKFIQEVIKNPNGIYNLGGIYCGGIDVADVAANDADTTVVQKDIPTYEYKDPTSVFTF